MRRDQRHHGGEVDACGPESAATAGWSRLRQPSTAQQKLKRSAYSLAQPSRAAARLAVKRRRMQRAAALASTGRPGEGRKVAVEDEQLLMELGVGQHGLVHWVRPLN